MEKILAYVSVHKKLVISVMISLVVASLAFVIWLLCDIAENKRIDAEAVTLVENLTIGFGEGAKVSDFLANLNGELVDDFVINTDKLGEQEITFDFINIRNKKRTRNFTITIVDKTAPRIYGGDAYTVYQNYAGDLTNLMLSGDDLDDNPVRKIVGDYDLGKVGSYDLEYVITDSYSNETRKKFTLYVTQPEVAEEEPPYTLPKLPFADVIKEHKSSKTKIGIDVSAWQGEIDWQKVKEAGAEFAMIRLGYQVDFGAKYVLDKYFAANIQGAEEAGLPVGVYFYSYANSIDEARKQAEWIVENLEGYQVELGVAFDWESWGEFNAAGMSFWTINKTAETFLKTAAKHGYRGWLYGSKNHLERIWDVENLDFGVWLAQYYDYVTYDGEYQMWQLSNTGRIDGIYGDVDVDVLYLDS